MSLMNGSVDGTSKHHHRPLVTVSACPTGHKCPFGNSSISFQLYAGGCVWLQGPSGRGKTTIAMHMAGLVPARLILKRLHLDIQCQWDPLLPVSERCGVLFQQTALLDELTVAGNLAVALRAAGERFAGGGGGRDRDARIKRLLTTVGLDYERDAAKRPAELSGGMARRAGTALQLAQKKHVIILDEPFAGLDHEAALSVAKELVHLRKTQNTALVLISHEPEIAQTVLGDAACHGNVIVTLTEPPLQMETHSRSLHKPKLFGTHFRDRFAEKLLDYVVYSLPLILLAFTATGMAIAMLSADSLSRMDVTEPVLKIVDQEVRPMIQLLTGAEPNAFHVMGVRLKVKQMLQQTVPPAKATLYAMGMAKLFVLEIGPLLTALLLCGRIGGSYAGHVATLQATAQTKLLQTLGISPARWSLYPAVAAAVVAGPVLTVVGTAVSLSAAGFVGPAYGVIGTRQEYWEKVRSNVFPALRLRGWVPQGDGEADAETASASSAAVLFYHARFYKTTFSPYWIDTVIEIGTYPTVYHILKAVTFMLIIMGVAEVCARSQPNLTSRGVPGVITSSVVSAGLLIILADWWFSRLWLRRH